MMRFSSHMTAFCGVSAALSVVLLLLGGLVPGATYCAPMLGMLPLIPCLCEYGRGAAACVYAVTAALTVLLAPDKEMAGVYVFFGYYPIIKPMLDRIPRRLLRLAAKLAVCLAAMGALYFLLLHVLGLAELTEELKQYAAPLRAALAAMGAAAFLLLDRALDRLTLLWRTALRRRFFRQ